MSVSRHRTGCLKAKLTKAVAKRDARTGDRLLSFGQKCIDVAESSLGELVTNKDHRTIPGMISAGMKAVETVARLECRPGFGDAVAPATTVNIAMVRMPSFGAAGDTADARPAPLLTGAGVTSEIVEAELVD